MAGKTEKKAIHVPGSDGKTGSKNTPTSEKVKTTPVHQGRKNMSGVDEGRRGREGLSSRPGSVLACERSRWSGRWTHGLIV
jgi:hypothetical protein